MSTLGLSTSTLRIGVSKISMVDYEMFFCNKDHLKSLAKPFGELSVESTADLEQVKTDFYCQTAGFASQMSILGGGGGGGGGARRVGGGGVGGVVV